jgi:hypothetical protein
MDHWEQAVRAALAERRRRLDEIDQEAAKAGRQIEDGRRRLEALAVARAGLEKEASLLDEITHTAGRPAIVSAINLDEAATPKSESAAPEGVVEQRPKIEIMLDLLRSFGARGASAKELAAECASNSLPVSVAWVSSCLSQKRRKGVVAGRNGVWWTVENAPDGISPPTPPPRRQTNRPAPARGLTEMIWNELQSQGEKGASTAEVIRRVHELRPGTPKGSISSCLSKFRKAGLAQFRDNRYIAVAAKP